MSGKENRVSFDFIRTAKVTQKGTCQVLVKEDTTEEEIREALNNRHCLSWLVLDDEWEDDTCTFKLSPPRKDKKDD